MHAHTPTPEPLAWNPPLWFDLLQVAFLVALVLLVTYTTLMDGRL